MSAKFNDQPMKALDKAVYWVEYVIRHKGAHHLHVASVELLWYQYYQLDIFAFIIFLTFLFILFLYFIYKRIMKCIINLLYKRKKIKSL